ncbi:MAG: fructose-bisphosphatase class III [Lachnospiraceae bacterium]|nr:fructose-bisphosphatase class III [Lachnospiraceae bacterium]
MSNYVMSDVHGQYKSYMKMLKKIDLKAEDTLYVLGDAIDRGSDGIKILSDIMKRPNVELILGNHELLMLDALKNFDEIRSKDRHDTDDIDLWLDPCNGGEATYEAFEKLTVSKRKAIVAFLEEAWIIRKLKVDNKTYHLSHAYTVPKKMKDGFRYSDLSHDEIWDVVWMNIYDRAFIRENHEKLYPNKKTIYVSGHTFTQRLDCIDELGRGLVYHNPDYYGYHVYNIDCGMALKNKSSQLSCMRLEDGEIFYIPLEARKKSTT